MSDPGRLAAAVRARREALMLSQAELAGAAGLSDSTVRSIESGRRDSLRASSRRALAVALGWAPGSLDLILEGGDPIPAEAPDTRTLGQRVAALEAELAELRDLVEASIVRHDPEHLEQLSQREGRRPADAAGRQRAG